ncbi:FUN14 domain-containing protein 1A-like [Anneissia japonica]|uniref:FUN14 domain-containing protein 1A-like n=1 Tax=Anneissia japonica TaxID=1529436 RepID=UPI001425B750|nr:FUN14 domain-containing protein 1A-like [Anneissia japonica]
MPLIISEIIAMAERYTDEDVTVEEEEDDEEIIELLDEKHNSEEPFEMLEFVHANKGWIQNLLGGSITERSTPVQIGFGGVSGWLAGHLFQKVGRLAATAVGGGFLLMLLAHHGGYIKVDWDKFEKDIGHTKRKVTREMNRQYPYFHQVYHQSREFARKNVLVSGGFVGGFLLGMST